jgi:hypothetical protein
MMEAVRTSETSVDNNFTWQYIPEDNYEHQADTLFLLHVSVVHYHSHYVNTIIVLVIPFVSGRNFVVSMEQQERERE